MAWESTVTLKAGLAVGRMGGKSVPDPGENWKTLKLNLTLCKWDK